MRLAIALCVFALLACASALAQPTSFAELAAREEVLTQLNAAQKELTMKDFLVVPFNMEDAKDAEMMKTMLANPALPAYRERRAQLEYHMSLAEYDAMHSSHREKLLSSAKALGIKYE